MGGFTAFLVALFTEMYGIPLTVYLLSGWLGSKISALSATHAGGHLFNDLIGWKGDPHLSPFHLLSYVFIGGGFWLVASARRVLFEAAKTGTLATTGPCAGTCRHPSGGPPFQVKEIGAAKGGLDRDVLILCGARGICTAGGARARRGGQVTGRCRRR